jgi:hypothetical protein
MRKSISVIALVILALLVAALPAAGEEPFPPADWEQTARFSGDHLYASFEGQQDGFSYISINGYDGSFRLSGVKGRGIQDQLVSVIFDMGACDPVTGMQTERHLMGALFTGNGPVPVYDSNTHSMMASLQLHGIERIYDTADCSWENRTFVSEEDIVADFSIDGAFVTEKCKGKCFAVCGFSGSMSLTLDATNLLEGIPFDAVSEGFGGTRNGDIFWYERP